MTRNPTQTIMATTSYMVTCQNEKRQPKTIENEAICREMSADPAPEIGMNEDVTGVDREIGGTRADQGKGEKGTGTGTGIGIDLVGRTETGAAVGADILDGVWLIFSV